MKRWDVYQNGKWVDGVQARDHSEAVLEALRNSTSTTSQGWTCGWPRSHPGKV